MHTSEGRLCGAPGESEIWMSCVHEHLLERKPLCLTCVMYLASGQMRCGLCWQASPRVPEWWERKPWEPKGAPRTMSHLCELFEVPEPPEPRNQVAQSCISV
jgi:hypothetical protein